MRRRLIGLLVVTGVMLSMMLAALPAAAAPTQDKNFLSVIQLPNGWQPEGIALGKGTTFYVGSLANGGIYRGDLRTGTGAVFVPGVSGRALTGLYVDKRHNYLFASGSTSGQGFVFDANTGATLATYQLAQGTPTFINDVIVTKDAAYFTDSSQPFFYKVPLGRHGELPPQSAVERIPLSGDYVFVPGAFNANGIEATPDGQTLFIVHTARGELYRVDAQTGVAQLVNLNGATLTNGDGLRRQGHTLYVVRNQNNEIAVLKLAHDWSSATLQDTLTSPNFDVPTTLGRFGDALYAVNARFTTPPTPDTPYTVVRVPLQHEHADDK